jgi:di/tricarboxylate transporter
MQKIPLSRLLMPVGFSAILGGTITLVGCSPLILLNDLLIPFNLKPFGLFDVTPIGFALVISGILCFIFLGKFILPQGNAAENKEDEQTSTLDITYDQGTEVNCFYELTTSDDFMDYRERVLVSDLRRNYLVNILGLTEPPDFKILSPSSGIVEAVIAPRSQFTGRSLGANNFNDRFRVTPLVIHRQNKIYRAKLDGIILHTGDVISFYGTWKRLETLHNEGGLLFSLPSDLEDMRPEKALWAGGWLILALVMIMGFHIQLSVASH